MMMMTPCSADVGYSDALRLGFSDDLEVGFSVDLGFPVDLWLSVQTCLLPSSICCQLCLLP